MGFLHRIYIPLQEVDGTGALTGAPQSATVDLIRPGAESNGTNLALGDGATQTITVFHPGSLRAADRCYLYKDSSGLDADTNVLINSVTFDPTDSDWDISITNNSGKSITVEEYDRLVVKQDNGVYDMHVRLWDDDSESSNPTQVQIALSTDAVISGFVDHTDVDVLVTNSAGTKFLHFDIPARRNMWVTPEEFGAYGNGGVDDTVAVQAAADFCGANGYILKFIPGKTYLVSSQIIVWSDVDGKGSTISSTSTNRTLLFEHKVAGTSLKHKHIHLPKIVQEDYVVGDAWAVASTGVLMTNLVYCVVVVPYIGMFQEGLRLGGASTNPGAIKYNHFDIGILDNCKVPLKLYATDSDESIRYNIFNGGYLYHNTGEAVGTAGAYKVQMGYSGLATAPIGNIFIGLSYADAASAVTQYSVFCEGDSNLFLGGDWTFAAPIYFDISAGYGVKNIFDGGTALESVTLTGWTATAHESNWVIAYPHKQLTGLPTDVTAASATIDVPIGRRLIKCQATGNHDKITYNGASPNATTEGVIITIFAEHASGLTLRHAIAGASGDICTSTAGSLTLAQKDTAILQCIHDGSNYVWVVLAST